MLLFRDRCSLATEVWHSPKSFWRAGGGGSLTGTATLCQMKHEPFGSQQVTLERCLHQGLCPAPFGEPVQLEETPGEHEVSGSSAFPAPPLPCVE